MRNESERRLPTPFPAYKISLDSSNGESGNAYGFPGVVEVYKLCPFALRLAADNNIAPNNRKDSFNGNVQGNRPKKDDRTSQRRSVPRISGGHRIRELQPGH